MTRAPSRRQSAVAALLFATLFWSAPTNSADAPPPQQRPQTPPSVRGFYKSQITPHWFHDNTRFWYRNDTRDNAKDFVVVDVEAGTRKAAFDHQKLAAALNMAADMACKPHRLPFDAIEFIDDGKAIRFQVGKKTWKCGLESYELTGADADPEPQQPKPAGADKGEAELTEAAVLESPFPDGLNPEAEQQPDSRAQAPGERESRPVRSPDKKWTAFIKENNVWLRGADDDKEIQLSQDGKPSMSYGVVSWAPDSKTLAACRIEPGDKLQVSLIESSPPGGGRAKLHTRPYALPGDKFTAYELNVFDVTGQKQVRPEVELIDTPDFERPRLRWNADGKSFTYQKVDRGHQRFRLIEIDALTGEARNIIDETSGTFIWTAHGGKTSVTWLEKTDELIYQSERDGWWQLYLVDAAKGEIKNQITKGEWVVRGIDRIDEEKRQIWFRASGMNPRQDPYLIHYYRVNFDGTDLVALTEGDGNHTIQLSPDRKYLIDTYSRVDLPPVHELRRASDGKLVCELEKADISELKTRGWEPPEIFVAKGRDGKTDIWGTICRPAKFDASKKYPVIEQIYAGPQGSFVPKSFSPIRRFASLTDLGFIVVQIDGMGTANRSKAFHDVCWKNLKDAGFPDRILWHYAAAKKYPYYDLSRVGIYGTSAGGQNSTAALLFHPEFYKVAVSACGCHDNRMDKASWNEQWMGYPVGPQYSDSSNIDHARQLQGKLLLIVGEMDTNVPPESTMRLVDVLIKAGKDFDLLVVPGMGHSNGGAYGNRRLQDFFVRHLLGTEPPNRNAGPERRADGG
jgi:dipeptidyl aminopeptidase/acylaminoacyl peptidase